jgi:hypothetical protein
LLDFGLNHDEKETTVSAIPPYILKKLYVKDSLRVEDGGLALDLKNSIAPATIVAFTGLDLDGQALDLAQAAVFSPDGDPRALGKISAESPLPFPLHATVTLRVAAQALDPGSHELVIRVIVQDVGSLNLPVSDTLA